MFKLMNGILLFLCVPLVLIALAAAFNGLWMIFATMAVVIAFVGFAIII
jgi:hypothetical protein